jgi:predicted amidohydrolase
MPYVLMRLLWTATATAIWTGSLTCPAETAEFRDALLCSEMVPDNSAVSGPTRNIEGEDFQQHSVDWFLSYQRTAAGDRNSPSRNQQASPSAGERVRIRIAGAQVPVVRDVSQNVETLTRAIEYAAREKADVLITPEGSLSGYTPGFDATATQGALDKVLQRARTAKLALVLGTCFQAEDGRRYNAQRFYDKEGTYLGFHAKILLCRRMANPEAKGEMDSFQSRPLRTFNLFGLTVGGLICNDMWANPEYTPMDDPHLSQRLKEMGARVIFLSANTGWSTGESLALNSSYHETNLRLRARAGKLWIVVANAVDPTGEKASHCPSGILAPDGIWALTTSPRGEQFFVHTIEVDTRASLDASP